MSETGTDGRGRRARRGAWRVLGESLRPRASRGQLLAALLLGMLGFALVVQLRSTDEINLATLRQSDLVRILDDWDAAEEIAQETFVRALRQAELTSARSWLYAVATNLLRDEMRKDARRRARLEQLVADARALEEDIVPLPVDRGEDNVVARAALKQLTERDREALLMREEGLDYGEIAAALELSIGSVGTTLSRARRRLVEAYESLRAGAGGGSDVAS